MLIGSFTQIGPTEVALKYNYVLQTVSPDIVNVPGLYFVGPFTSLLRFPSTLTWTVLKAQDPCGPPAGQSSYYWHRQYDPVTCPNPDNLLDGRTSDGLPLLLGVQFQWQLNLLEVYELYHEFDMLYEDIFRVQGTHLITEVATRFKAYDYFNDKLKVQDAMKEALNNYFKEHLHAQITGLQITDDTLPRQFSSTVTQAQNIQTQIETTQNIKKQREVQFQQNVMVANNTAQATINEAKGLAAAVLQKAEADSDIVKAYTAAEAFAYGEVKSALKLEGDHLLDYMWYDIVGGGGVGAEHGFGDNTMLVGVNPSAYIAGNQ